jgi:hypothetical protein
LIPADSFGRGELGAETVQRGSALLGGGVRVDGHGGVERGVPGYLLVEEFVQKSPRGPESTRPTPARASWPCSR